MQSPQNMLRLNFLHLVTGRPVVGTLSVACRALTCTRNLSDRLSTWNLSDRLSTRNLSDCLSTRNLSDCLSTWNLSDRLSTRNLSDLLSTRNLSDRLSTRNLSDCLSTWNLSDRLSTRNLSDFLSTRNLSDCLGRPEDNLEPIDLRKYSDQEIRGVLNDKRDFRNLTLANITVLGTGGNELSPSFAVHTDRMTYLFNLGEGWERITVAHNRHVAKRLITFFTRSCWENCGGCLGVYHWLKSRQSQQDYVGPVQMGRFVDYMNRYIGAGSWNDKRSGLGYFQLEDENMTVSVIDVDPPAAGSVNDAGTVVAYSCKLSDPPRKFLADKATALGVSNGWALRALYLGRSVITKEGNLVHPHQVMADTRKGDTFLVVDCPTERFMDAVTTNQYLQPERYAKLDENLALVVHITPLDILQQEDYCKWMASFGEGTKHLFLHSSICPGEIGYRESMTSTLPFHLMNPKVYPLPCHPVRNIVNKAELNASKYVKEDSIIIGRMLLKYHIKPKTRVDYSECLEDIEQAVKNKLSSIRQETGLQSKILHHRNHLSVKSATEDTSIDNSMEVASIMSTMARRDSNLTLTSDPNDALITVLGTSSGSAVAFRGLSGILVQTPTAGNVLLDCGEGTLCQLYRCFGVDAARAILRSISVIFISHFHTDHNFGVGRLLDEIHGLTANDPSHIVTIVTFSGISNTLKKYGVCKDLRLKHVSAYDTVKNPYPCRGGVSIETVPVKHIKHSFGCVLRKGSEWSIVYSGDTLPSEDLTEAGQDATLLIHEATFDNECTNEAISRKHCTYSQAVEAGVDMNAKFTLTTHFSSRWPWFPLLAKYSICGTSPAIDFMTLRLLDLHDQLLDSDSCRDVFDTISASYK